MRNRRRKANSRLEEGLNPDDLSLLEVLVRFQREASRNPDIKARLAELGQRLGHVAAAELRARTATRAGS